MSNIGNAILGSCHSKLADLSVTLYTSFEIAFPEIFYCETLVLFSRDI